MGHTGFVIAFVAAMVVCVLASAGASPSGQVKTANGAVQGVTDPVTGVHMYKGIPYAQPPVGDLRWKGPQPVKNWPGVLKADKFGARAAQHPISDMVFRSENMSEDCLYLNVWTPADSEKAHLPVLVYFYGGGFFAGDGSEYRYDGESLAQRGIVVVTVNYRLGIFGYFAYPELTKESSHHASGNYGLMDQSAALQWVHRNIAAFGGDPKHITIGGESAGSMSVSAQMASPLSRKLIAGAIGESGSFMGTLTPVSLADAELAGTKFADGIGAKNLAALRALSTSELLADVANLSSTYFSPIVDGYFLPKPLEQIYAAGEQAHVPLLVGWNSEEGNPNDILKGADPTLDNYQKAMTTRFGASASDMLKWYPGSTSDEILDSAQDLASDEFISFSTWKWFDMQCKTGQKPVYRYYFLRARATKPEYGTTPDRGATHSGEIEYALGNLATAKYFAFTDDDYKVSATMEGYFANFIKTFDPNGPGLPEWPAATSSDNVPVMHIDVESKAEPAAHTDRYHWLDQIYTRTGSLP